MNILAIIALVFLSPVLVAIIIIAQLIECTLSEALLLIIASLMIWKLILRIK